MASIFVLFLWWGESLQKEMAILEVKDMKAHSVFNTCSQLYPLASLTRLISMGNVYMKTKRLVLEKHYNHVYFLAILSGLFD